MEPRVKLGASIKQTKPIDFKRIKKRILRHWQLYLFIALPLAYIIIFGYVPIVNSVIAFKDYKLNLGIWGSEWIGFEHFTTFFQSYQFNRLLFNTLGLSIYSIVAGFFPPILLALGLNYARMKFFKKSVQMITYMPYFISTVLVVGILSQILSLNGPINQILSAIGIDPIQFLGDPKWFKTVYVFSGIWQSTGYNAIVYLAALSGISPELYEAAKVDGANIWQRIWHIDIPGIAPTAIILLILNSGKVLNVGFEKVFLLQNPMNMSASDIISTYVYKIGMVSMQYSYSTAIGLFQSVVSLIVLVIVNKIANKVSDSGLW